MPSNQTNSNNQDHRQSESVDSIFSIISRDIIEGTYDHFNTQYLVQDAKRIIDKTEFPKPETAQGVDRRKLLEGMLDFCPSVEGQHWIALAIHAAHNNETQTNSVPNLAQSILENLLFPMMSVAWDKITQTSIASSSHSPSINQTAVVVESADRAEQKEFADQLKLRERYQCIVTGYFLPSAPEPWILLPGVGVGELEAAHIIPLALNSDKKPPEPMAPTWDMLKHWTQIDPEDYAGGRITCPENGVLLTKREHHAFGTFKLWFDPVLSANAEPIPHTFFGLLSCRNELKQRKIHSELTECMRDA